MNESDLVNRLTQGIASAIRSGNYCVHGSLPNIAPEIEVEGLGPVHLPLKPIPAKRLIAVCEQAPFGKGTQTLVDTKVRNAFELSPKRFKVTSSQWEELILETTKTIAGRLGLPEGQLEPELYKLLVYRKGGFFLPHRDSEKTDRMVASLIVALPTPFEDGTLTVRHQKETQRIKFKNAAAGTAPDYAAFYADCEHEVSKVTNGYRLCLAYNLIMRSPPSQKTISPSVKPNKSEALSQGISTWTTVSPSDPLVFAFDHQYTERGLSLDLLKGKDRALANAVAAAAEQADCHVYLCQVSRHLNQQADDGSYGRRYGRHYGYSKPTPDRLNLGEIYEDELQGEQWVDVNGKKLPFPTIKLSTKAIVASTPLDEWKPTREEYEGYTGNAGNTLDRWYHRSALCVWHRDHHFKVLAQGDVYFALHLLADMVKKLKKAPKKKSETTRGDCIRLSRAIIKHWPKHRSYYPSDPFGRGRLLKDFPKLLLEIDDAETACQFLECARQNDESLDLKKLVVAMCRNHGCARFAQAMAAFFETPVKEIPQRDFAWLEHFATIPLEDPERNELLTNLATLAATRFRQSQPSLHVYDEKTRQDQDQKILLALTRTLILSSQDQSLEKIIRFVDENEKRFTIENVQTPCLGQIVAWCQKQKIGFHPLIREWLQTLHQKLTKATINEPKPPSDWDRSANMVCNCPFCKQLNHFLSDPHEVTGRIKASETDRSHLIYKIQERDCDVTYKLEKKGSPYALVFTKTTGTFDRLAARYQADLKLLETINELLAETKVP